MMDEVPEKFELARRLLRYSAMDTGDRYAVFAFKDDIAFDVAMVGNIVGMIVPADAALRRSPGAVQAFCQ